MAQARHTVGLASAPYAPQSRPGGPHDSQQLVRRWGWIGTFLVGGALYLLVLAVLTDTGNPNLFPTMILLGALVVPLTFATFAAGRSGRWLIDGPTLGGCLLFGGAVGTGFAVLETMGYAFVALLQSGGNVGAAEQTLFIRGLLSPAGHAAWDGIGGRITYAVVGAISIGLLLYGLRRAQRSDNAVVPA